MGLVKQVRVVAAAGLGGLLVSCINWSSEVPRPGACTALDWRPAIAGLAQSSEAWRPALRHLGSDDGWRLWLDAGGQDAAAGDLHRCTSETGAVLACPRGDDEPSLGAARGLGLDGDTLLVSTSRDTSRNPVEIAATLAPPGAADILAGAAAVTIDDYGVSARLVDDTLGLARARDGTVYWSLGGEEWVRLDASGGTGATRPSLVDSANDDPMVLAVADSTPGRLIGWVHPRPGVIEANLIDSDSAAIEAHDYAMATNDRGEWLLITVTQGDPTEARLWRSPGGPKSALPLLTQVGETWTAATDPNAEYQPQIVRVSGGYAIAWTAKETQGPFRTQIVLTDTRGEPRGAPISIEHTGRTAATLAARSDGLALGLAWLDDDHRIRFRLAECAP